MTTTHVPFDIPEDLRRGLAVEAARSGKSQSRIVAEALEKAGIDRVSADDMDKLMHGSQ
jgi:hypothetical protein